MIGKSWIEKRLEDLKQRLLDEAIQNRRDAELPLAAAGLGNGLSFHWLRSVGAREQLLAHSFPVLMQPEPQIIYRHPVDPGTAFVFPNSLVRGQHVGAAYHPFHETARS